MFADGRDGLYRMVGLLALFKVGENLLFSAGSI